MLTKTMLVIDEDEKKKLRFIALKEEKSMSQIVRDLIARYISQYEKAQSAPVAQE